MKTIIEMVEDLKSQIKVPEIEDSYLHAVWMIGRNDGISKIRNHVRHHANEVLPYLQNAPKTIRQEMKQDAAAVWLNGYNTVIQYVEEKINAMISLCLKNSY